MPIVEIMHMNKQKMVTMNINYPRHDEWYMLTIQHFPFIVVTKIVGLDFLRL